MADEIDMAQERAHLATEYAIRNVMASAVLDPGVAGECEMCGEWSGRLVGGACAPCRDRYKLP